MKYLFLLYDNEATQPTPGSTELQDQSAAYGAFFQDVSERGLFRSGDPVQRSETATTVRVRNGSSAATSGPFHPKGDQIVGFYVLDCEDAEQAVACAAHIPAARTGAVEVRPILAM